MNGNFQDGGTSALIGVYARYHAITKEGPQTLWEWKRECGERARGGFLEDLVPLLPLQTQIKVNQVKVNQADRANVARLRGVKRPEGVWRTR